MAEKHILFRERLSDELTYQGISKIDFAERVGISINTLNMYLYRGSIPAADVAVALFQNLKNPPSFSTKRKSILVMMKKRSEFKAT